MKIGFNYTSTIGVGGNATYARGLIKGLAEIDKNNEYYLYYFVHDFLLGRKPKTDKNFKLKPAYFSRLKLPIPRGVMSFINKLSIKIWTRLNKIDIFHFTNPLDFVKGPYKGVVTLHDLAVFHNESWAKKISLDFYNKNIEKVLHQADKIITDAEFTKKDIIRFLNIKQEKIKSIHLAASNIFHPSSDKKDYILYVGELQPRKNIIRLLEAYSKLDINLRKKHNLILVGKARDKEFAEKVNKTIKDLNIDVKQLDFVADSDLPKLYGEARCLAYPSLFEGFGLPVLESISCGTPVIASNTSSLPEVVGDAGILIDPKNVEEIKSAMEKLLLDKQFYHDLKNKCLKQASKFSWQKTAKETLAVYEGVYRN